MLLEVELRDYRRRFKQDWANLTVLHWPNRDEGPMLLLANDVAHILGIQWRQHGNEAVSTNA